MEDGPRQTVRYRAHHRREVCRKAGIGKEEDVSGLNKKVLIDIQ